ncbi:MAG: hypothetical protein WCJ18_07885, partial [Planctomycetota bacterium]
MIGQSRTTRALDSRLPLSVGQTESEQQISSPTAMAARKSPPTKALDDQASTKAACSRSIWSQIRCAGKAGVSEKSVKLIDHRRVESPRLPGWLHRWYQA